MVLHLSVVGGGAWSETSLILLTFQPNMAACLTCVTRGGGVRPGDRADDVEVLEESDPARRSEVGLRPGQPLGSADGYPGLAGLQHHHHGVDVGDGDAGVLAETSGKERST